MPSELFLESTIVHADRFGWPKLGQYYNSNTQCWLAQNRSKTMKPMI